MSLTDQQRQQIGQNANAVLTSCASIVATIAQKKHIDGTELRKMDVVANANIGVAIATLIMFCHENAETSCILTRN